MSNKSIVIRYIFSGVIASVVMFGLLIFFKEVLGIWYLYSSTLAFALAFITSFLLQKFWTFRNFSRTNTYKQIILFLIVNIVSLGVNVLGMFVLVDKIGIWYFVSQIVVSGFIAIWSFFAYRAILLGKDEVEKQIQDINSNT